MPALAACLALLAASPPPHVLVYSYTYESGRSADAEKAYGVDKMDPGSGGTFMFHNVNQHYRSPTFDAAEERHGTIAVEIVRPESDGGLVLRVSESGAATGGATGAAATCVAFGDTTVVCDPTKTISPEAAALLTLLGANFVDASRLDASRHWHVSTAGSYGTAADFTIERTSGTTLDISETGVAALPGTSGKAEVAAAIVYDAARSLPLSVDEFTVQRPQRGGVVSETISSHTILTLTAP